MSTDMETQGATGGLPTAQEIELQQAQALNQNLTHQLAAVSQELEDMKVSFDKNPSVILGEAVKTLNIQVATSTAQGLIEKFMGNPKRFRTWIREVERAALVSFGGVTSQTASDVALLSSGGAVAEFLMRFREKKTVYTWEGLKAELEKRFGQQQDTLTKVLKLRQTKQKANQNEHSYAEYLISLAKEAYEDNFNNPLVQKELVSTFCTGLKNQRTALKILRKNPETLHEAVSISAEETLFNNRVQAHGISQGTVAADKEVPMEVDLVSRDSSSKKAATQEKATQQKGKIKCFYCSKTGHVQRSCYKKQNDEKKKKEDQSTGQSSRPAGKKNLVCFYCQKKGHVIRECFKKTRDEARTNTSRGDSSQSSN